MGAVTKDEGNGMRQVRIGRGDDTTGAVGLGCMGMSWAYDENGRDTDTSISVIHRAIDLGANLIDTADQYGPFVNERLVGRALRDRRDRAFLATKAGLIVDGAYKTYRNGRPEHLRSACEASLIRLGVDHIDLYQLHRLDPAVPFEESWGALAELVTEGKVRHIGLSEVSVDEISLADRIHPVASVQSELSVSSREAINDGIVKHCADNDISFIAFAPLGRGFLAGTINSVADIPEVDGRHRHPRYQADTLAANQAVLEPIRQAAGRLGVTVAQVALAWVLRQAPNMIVLPGTKTPRYLADNVASAGLDLPDDVIRMLDDLPAAAGRR